MVNKMTHFTKPDSLPKYFGIDVDGTFYTTNEDVYKRNVEALRTLKDKNITPFFCTARRPDSVKSLMGEQFFKDCCFNIYPGIYANGAVVYDSDGKLIKFEKFPQTFLDKFIEYTTKKDINSWVLYSNGKDFFTIENMNKELKKYYPQLTNEKVNKIDYSELKQNSVNTIIVIKYDIIDFELIDEANYVIYNESKQFQISPKNCNKKTGLEAFLNHVNSKPEECAYIGDNTNDHEAMEYCKTSFAVGNADEETKQKAKWVLDIKHDEGAFEKAVKLLCDD